MRIAGIKGSVFGASVEDVNKLIASGALGRDEARRWLEPDDFEVLGRPVQLASWYDVRVYDRLNQLLRDVEGGGDPRHLTECGRRTARRLLEAGLYAQLEYVQRTEVEQARAVDRFAAFGRDLRKLSTLSASIFNFSRWSVAVDPEHDDRYRIDVAEARDFPDSLAWRTEGFINEMASRHGTPDLWCWRRAAPDLLHFEMVRPL